MLGKNYWLAKCFVFTTNFEPIVKQSVANNTLLSHIFVKKPIYFYILDLYFRTGKNRVLDLYFRTEGVNAFDHLRDCPFKDPSKL